jgi:enoyl-CoA hydratase/carnithine racemase
MLMLLTGEPISGAQADAMGLISQAVPDGTALDAALAIAARIAAMPPLAAALIKDLVLSGADTALASAMAHERRALALLFATEDQKEGANAFLEKRPPVFRGR